jgi:hypothetical protein
MEWRLIQLDASLSPPLRDGKGLLSILDVDFRFRSALLPMTLPIEVSMSFITMYSLDVSFNIMSPGRWHWLLVSL